MQNKNTKILRAERRKQVISMLTHSMTGLEISKKLKVHSSTISRDITYIKKESQQFIYNLAKSDLAYYFQQCLATVEEVKRKAWKLFESRIPEKDKIVALKLIVECEQVRYSMLKDGPFLMNIKALQEKINTIERSRKYS